jgi:hypothetical protein
MRAGQIQTAVDFIRHRFETSLHVATYVLAAAEKDSFDILEILSLETNIVMMKLHSVILRNLMC